MRIERAVTIEREPFSDLMQFHMGDQGPDLLAECRVSKARASSEGIQPVTAVVSPGLMVASSEADYFGTDAEPPRFAAVAATGSLLDEAARLCASHGLRVYDAVQLSSALAVRRADESCTQFAAFDRALRTAAAAEGFELLPSDVLG